MDSPTSAALPIERHSFSVVSALSSFLYTLMVACESTPITVAGKDFKENLATTIGSWLIGCAFMMFAQGILFMQTAQYFRLCQCDRRPTKALVALVFTITLIKCVFAFRNVWHITVGTYGDFDAGGRLTWTSGTNLVTDHVITFICQTFYLKIIWSIKRGGTALKWVAGLATLACGASLTLSIFMTVPLVLSVMKYSGDISLVDPRLSKLVRPTFLAGTALLVVADTTITGTMIWFLLSSQRDCEINPDYKSYPILQRLLRVTVESAAPPLVITLLTLGFSSRANSFYRAFCLLMPSMYAVCLMHTINCRCRNRILHHANRSTRTAERSAQHRDPPGCSVYSSTPPQFAEMNTGSHMSTGSSTMIRTASGQDRQTSSSSIATFNRPAEGPEGRLSSVSQTISNGDADTYELMPISSTAIGQHRSTTNDTSTTSSIERRSPPPVGKDNGVQDPRSTTDESVQRKISTPRPSSEIVSQSVIGDECV